MVTEIFLSLSLNYKDDRNVCSEISSTVENPVCISLVKASDNESK